MYWKYGNLNTEEELHRIAIKHVKNYVHYSTVPYNYSFEYSIRIASLRMKSGFCEIRSILRASRDKCLRIKQESSLQTPQGRVSHTVANCSSENSLLTGNAVYPERRQTQICPKAFKMKKIEEKRNRGAYTAQTMRCLRSRLTDIQLKKLSDNWYKQYQVHRFFFL